MQIAFPSLHTQIDREVYFVTTQELEDRWPDLTPKEREIFDFYLAGKNGKEIQETLSISENTLKYHNKHIYQTLNITSRKELLRYAAMMQESDAAKPD